MFVVRICSLSTKVRQLCFSDPFSLRSKQLQPDYVSSHDFYFRVYRQWRFSPGFAKVSDGGLPIGIVPAYLYFPSYIKSPVKCQLRSPYS